MTLSIFGNKVGKMLNISSDNFDVAWDKFSLVKYIPLIVNIASTKNKSPKGNTRKFSSCTCDFFVILK